VIPKYRDQTLLSTEDRTTLGIPLCAVCELAETMLSPRSRLRSGYLSVTLSLEVSRDYGKGVDKGPHCPGSMTRVR
jgi:hypothetical protein